jgi:2-methylisocitrate lyase-like PEP mutase family enzyme
VNILEDCSFTVPAVPPASTGVAWLRSQVARFAEGDDRRRRRELTAQLLAPILPERLRRPGNPVANLAEALALPRAAAADVAIVAPSYLPHTAITPEADAAVERLVRVAGGERDELTAARIGLLVQSCAATRAMIEGCTPPVPHTRRISPTGHEVLVDLTQQPFGAGRHACLGRDHALALVDGALSFHRLHGGLEPLIVPTAWDAASADVLAAAGFSAISVTRPSGTAGRGQPQPAHDARVRTLDLARRLAALPVPVSIGIDRDFDADPVELAAELSTIGVAGVELADSAGAALADDADQARLIDGLKRGAPELFVNARVDTHRLGIDRPKTLARARAYVAAGADGIFVPDLVDEDHIAQLVAIGVSVTLLNQLPLSMLGRLGVRRISYQPRATSG